jgi:hypothetical protein
MININLLFKNGQASFFDVIKSSLYNLNQNIFEKLDFHNDIIYSEPLLFSYFTHTKSKMSISQILFGYYSNENKPTSFKVKSDKKGYIYLPNYGYLTTTFLETEFSLEYSNKIISISLSGNVIAYKSKPLLKLDKFKNIELLSIIDVFSEKYFYKWEGMSAEEAENFIGNNDIDLAYFKPIIENSFNILEEHFPNEFIRYIKSTRKIVLFTHPKLRNFTTRESHGCIYLNVNDKSTVSFFLEEIIHQCSHTVFNSVTFNVKDYFQVDPNKLLGDYFTNNDHRTLNGAFHGIYTTGEIVNIFLKLIKVENDFDKETKYELLGRLALNKNRINLGLERAPINQIFTKKGREVFLFFNKKLIKNITKNPTYFNFKMSTHPVVFDFNHFKEDNPIELFDENFPFKL